MADTPTGGDTPASKPARKARATAAKPATAAAPAAKVAKPKTVKSETAAAKPAKRASTAKTPARRAPAARKANGSSPAKAAKAAKAVVAFSSPGVIPGLIGPTAYAKLDVPLLVLTGDRDVVPGFVPDWHDHLKAFETSPAGDKHAWIGASVDHMYGGAILGAGKDTAQVAAFAQAQALSTVFLRATVLGEAAAKAQLAAAKSSPVAELRAR